MFYLLYLVEILFCGKSNSGVLCVSVDFTGRILGATESFRDLICFTSDKCD
jgi:hypothetical protein